MKNNSEKKKNQGRSLVEMLGVLAIIMVLTIGGLWGYKQSSDSHQANDMLNDVRFMAGLVISSEETETMADAENAQRRIIVVDDFEKSNPLEMKAVILSADDEEEDKGEKFAVEVKDVSKSVCLLALNRGKDTYEIVINGSEAESEADCVDTNQMQFLFDWTDTSVLDDGDDNAGRGSNLSACDEGFEACFGDCCDTKTQTCDAGLERCIAKNCPIPCYGSCCKSGQRCDTGDHRCVDVVNCPIDTFKCYNDCCNEDQRCNDATKKCETATDCPAGKPKPCFDTCCSSDEYCNRQSRACKPIPQCENESAICGDGCCGDNEVCENDQCVEPPCPDDQVKCGTCCSVGSCTTDKTKCCTISTDGYALEPSGNECICTQSDLPDNKPDANGNCFKQRGDIVPVPDDVQCEEPMQKVCEVVLKSNSCGCREIGGTELKICCKEGEVASFEENGTGHCCPESRPTWSATEGKCVKEACTIGDNSTCPGNSVCLYETLSNLNAGSWDDLDAGRSEDGCYSGAKPTCVKKPPLSSLKTLIGKQNGIIFFLSDQPLTWKNAQRFCESYGMHLANGYEACLRSSVPDKGHACPNLIGTFKEYHALEKQHSGDAWLGHEYKRNASKFKTNDVFDYSKYYNSSEYCWALQVTNGCGNNHYERKQAQRYALCTFGTNKTCTAAELEEGSGATVHNYCTGMTFNSVVDGKGHDANNNVLYTTKDTTGGCTNCEVINWPDYITTKASCSNCKKTVDGKEVSYRFFVSDTTCSPRCKNLATTETNVGHCYSCDYSTPLVYKTTFNKNGTLKSSSGYVSEAECKRCPNRIYIPSTVPELQGYGECNLCPKGYGTTADQSQCVCQKGNNGETMFPYSYCGAYDKKGNCTSMIQKCVACTYSGTFIVSKDECHLCDNRFHHGADNKGTCYSCLYQSTVSNVTKEECDRCGENRIWTRNTSGDRTLGKCERNKNSCSAEQMYDKPKPNQTEETCCWGDVYCGVAKVDGVCPCNKTDGNGKCTLGHRKCCEGNYFEDELGKSICCNPNGSTGEETEAYCSTFNTTLKDGKTCQTYNCAPISSTIYCKSYFDTELKLCRQQAQCSALSVMKKYDRGDGKFLDVCCSENGTPYCTSRNTQTGLCSAAACCDGAVGMINQQGSYNEEQCLSTCTQDQELYCYKSKFNTAGECTSLQCCTGNAYTLNRAGVKRQSGCCKPGVPPYITQWDTEGEPIKELCCGENKDEDSDESDDSAAGAEGDYEAPNTMRFFSTKYNAWRAICCKSRSAAVCKKYEECTPTATEDCTDYNKVNRCLSTRCANASRSVTTIYHMDAHKAPNDPVQEGSRYTDKVCVRNNIGYCFKYNHDTHKCVSARCCNGCKEYDPDGGECKTAGSITPFYAIDDYGNELKSDLQYHKCCKPGKKGYCNRYVKKTGADGKSYWRCREWTDSNGYTQAGHCCEGDETNISMIKNRDGQTYATSTFFRNTCCKADEVGYCTSYKGVYNSTDHTYTHVCNTNDDGSGKVGCCVSDRLFTIRHRYSSGEEIKFNTDEKAADRGFYQYKCCKAGETGYCSSYSIEHWSTPNGTINNIRACTAMACCTGKTRDIFHEGEGGTFYKTGCCSKSTQTPYCSTYKNGLCTKAACCSGTVTRSAGRDVCS